MNLPEQSQPADDESALSPRASVAVMVAISMVAIAVVLWQYNRDTSYRQYVMQSYGKAKASLTYYNASASEGNLPVSVHYQFTVDGKQYTREMSTRIQVIACRDVRAVACEHATFWVIYATEDPAKSLIDLSRNIDGDANAKFPESLDAFY